MNYLERFLSSRSAENLMPLFSKCAKPAKEITESWGMLEAAKQYCTELWKWKCIVVGDGRTPRTAAFMSFYTGVDALSVDPDASGDLSSFYAVNRALGIVPKRLSIVKSRIEDYGAINCDGKPVVVIWPHSHAPMDGCQVENYAKRVDIALPCCVQIPRNLLEKPHVHYVDYKITSPKREIFIWGVESI